MEAIPCARYSRYMALFEHDCKERQCDGPILSRKGGSVIPIVSYSIDVAWLLSRRFGLPTNRLPLRSMARIERLQGLPEESCT